MDDTLHNRSNDYDNVTYADERYTLRIDDRSKEFRFEFHTNADIIFNIICAVIAGLGFFGNFVTCVIISCQSKLHTPTFVAIKCLAVSDFFGIITVVFESFTNVLSLLRKRSIFNDLYIIIINTVHLNSPGHVLLLCTVRYLLVVHPLDSRQYLSVAVVSLGSLSLWMSSFLFSVIYNLLIFIYNVRDLKISLNIERGVTIIVILYLIAVVFVILIMHYRKMLAIRKSSTRRQIETKMNLITTVMLLGFVVCRIPDIFVNILIAIDKVELFSLHMIYSYYLLRIINFSFNPYIFFLFSILRSCKRFRAK